MIAVDLVLGIDIAVHDGLPLFEVKAEGRYVVGGVLCCDLVFRCPRCRQLNRHGGFHGRPGLADGHRVSHCGCWADGYYIKEVG